MKAGEISDLISSKLTFGSENLGKLDDSCPNTLPIVLTSSPMTFTRIVVTTMATRDPGILSVTLGHTSIITTARRPTRVAVQLIVPIF